MKNKLNVADVRKEVKKLGTLFSIELDEIELDETVGAELQMYYNMTLVKVKKKPEKLIDLLNDIYWQGTSEGCEYSCGIDKDKVKAVKQFINKYYIKRQGIKSSDVATQKSTRAKQG